MIKLMCSSILTFFVFGQLNAQRIIRGPYLQQPNADGITIRWQTDSLTTTKVSFWAENSNKLDSVSSLILTKEHIITLQNLLANKKYFYRIETADKTLKTSDYQHFKTSPPTSTNKPISFWAMGDFGASDTQKYKSNQEAVKQQFLQHRKQPTDLWLWLGDNAYCCGTQAEYQTQVFDFYGEELFGNIPILPSPGNHEYYGNYPEYETLKKSRAIPYFDMFTMPTKGESGGVPSGVKAYYSVNYGNVHFVSLDTYGYDDEQFPLADKRSKQYQWLERDLAANTQPWTVVFFHHPPYTKRSHDSDGEDELRVIRETLVPVFDKHKVDLVLSGHSHVYERSFLMKNHTGHSTTFDVNQHVVQQTKAFYTADSPPIINKTEGTIYMVIGSAGRLDWNQQLDAHPSSVYSNYEIGGSALFTVNENRLDAEWISADGVIRDKFAVFKNVNKRTDIQLFYGDSTMLTPSWKGSYRWADSKVNEPKKTVSPLKNTLYTVTDSLGYLIDSFFVFVSPQPIITAKPDLTQAIFEGKAFIVKYDLQHTEFEKWTYKVELSDANGSFEKPTVLATGKQAEFTVSIPTTIALQSDNYSLRVVPNVDFFDVIPSAKFTVNKKLIPLQKETEIANLLIFPNPSNDILVVENLPSSTEKIDIKITSLTGKMVFKNGYSFVNKLEIPIANLSSGVYMLEIKTSSQIITKRFLRR